MTNPTFLLSELWGQLWKYVVGFVTFPLVARLAGFVYQTANKRWQSVQTARRIISTQLDPLLKAADELQGKLRSIAEEDFREFRALSAEEGDKAGLVNLCSTLYLFAQFWARLEILRREGFHAELTRDKKGRILMDFLRCLESKQVRLVDRAWQRAIGEAVFDEGRPPTNVITFKSFVEQYEQNARLNAWLTPLKGVLFETRFRRTRQRVLQYGVIVQAMIDTLDPNHLSTRERPAYPNKLSRRAKRELIGRVFGTYLKDVRRTEKYTGIPR